MKNLIYFILLIGFIGNAQIADRNVDNERFRLYDNNVLVIGENISLGRYIFLDDNFVAPLRAESLWLPLWGADQLEMHIPIFRDTPINPRSIGELRLTADITQMDSYGTGSRLIRITKIWRTWYFHSGTSNPDYGYTLGVTPSDDTGGRHDYSLEDVQRRARDLATRSGQEIGVYRFTRITYDAYDLSSGRAMDVPGLERITIHTPYQLVETY